MHAGQSVTQVRPQRAVRILDAGSSGPDSLVTIPERIDATNEALSALLARLRTARERINGPIPSPLPSQGIPMPAGEQINTPLLRNMHNGLNLTCELLDGFLEEIDRLDIITSR